MDIFKVHVKTDLTRSDMTYIFLRLSQKMVKREYVNILTEKLIGTTLTMGVPPF